MSEQFEQRLVEPNSGLGKALRYLLVDVIPSPPLIVFASLPDVPVTF